MVGIVFSASLLILFGFCYVVRAEISSGRIKGDDEPHIVSWRVLEGVTEPFESAQRDAVPAWKQMKNAADQKAANMAIQQALHEYGQLLRHPYMFGDMPMEERYDVFLSMSKLLKIMGFHQRAELLLYEAMSYTTNPHEAHLQLGILFLDKEDLEKAKIHLKNCLFFKENDVLILIHLSVILIAEGRIHEAKFFLSRILSGLEARVGTLSFVMPQKEIQALTTTRVDYKVLSNWVEDLLVKVLYGEFRFTPSSTMDMLRLFSNLYRSVSDGEFTGRIIFDLGQSLYEGGRPKIGHMMMKRGFETSDAAVEGNVSTAIVDMRLALDYPVVPDSVVEVLEAYLNMTSHLSATSATYSPIDLENVIDLYWPLPLLGWSALPVMPVLTELLWRYQGGPVRNDTLSQYWLQETSYDSVLELYHPQREVFSPNRRKVSAAQKAAGSGSGVSKGGDQGAKKVDKEQFVFSFDALRDRNKEVRDGVRTVVIPPTTAGQGSGAPAAPPIKVEVGILGGHMNNHPVGQMIFRRLLGLHSPPSHSSSGGGTDWRELISLTLLALPLVPDAMTRRIAGSVARIVNLPIDTAQAWKVIESLHLDVLVFPDWQPFPDQQSVLFQSRRIAPVQVCMFVRGTSCASVAVDYYLMPAELEQAYLQSTPAAEIGAKVAVNTTVNAGNTVGKGEGRSSSSSSGDVTAASGPLAGARRQVVPQEGSFVPPPIPATSAQSFAPGTAAAVKEAADGPGSKPQQVRTVQRSLRPQWREFFAEQVVLLDWPLLTPAVVQGVAATVTADETTAAHRRGQRTPGGDTPSPTSTSSGGSTGSGATASAASSRGLDGENLEVAFSPLEIEGRTFFDNQPVAVLPLYPTYVHPLMDELVFKIMRSVPSLQVVIALPDSFFTHARDAKHKVSWARKLVRRLWARGGSLFHRIRLLPAPLTDKRLMQLLRQADMVLDSFPFGASFYFLSLALSVGTPVITLRSGTLLHSSKDELKEARNYLALSRQRQRQHNASALVNPMAQLVAQQDLPYFPAVSAIAGFYDAVGMAEHFVANGTAEYFQLASNVATNREYAYSLRVRLLEAVDDHGRKSVTLGSHKSSADKDGDGNSGAEHKQPQQSQQQTAGKRSTSTMEDWEEEEEQEHQPQQQQQQGLSQPTDTAEDSGDALWDCGHCVDDLGRFFLNVGVPFARSRTWRLHSMQQQRTGTTHIPKKHAAGTGPAGARGDDFHGTGTIS